MLGVDLLPGYYDPFSGRTLTKGEVGCFLSHYNIWKEVWGYGATGSLRATSTGQGPCEYHHVSGGPRETGVLQDGWTQYGPVWCWDGFALLPPPCRLCPGG